MDELIFWLYNPYVMIVAYIFAIIGFFTVLIGLINLIARPSKKQVVVPLAAVDSEAELRKALLQESQATPDLLAKLREQGALALNLLMPLYAQLRPGVAAAVKTLAADEQWFMTYGSRLGDDKYTAAVLAAAYPVFGDERTLVQQVDWLSRPGDAAQMETAAYLCALKEPKIIPYLVSALLQPSRFVTSRLAELFISYKDESGGVLAGILPFLSSNEEKRTLLTILEQLDTPWPTDNIVALLQDKDVGLRRPAAAALAERADKACSKQLLTATYDEDAAVRATACRALGAVAYSAAASRLEELAASGDAAVQKQAKLALLRLPK